MDSVRKAEASQNVSHMSRELYISNKTLHQSIKQFGRTQRLDLNTATMSELRARIQELERAVDQKDATICALKKAIAIVSQEKPNASQ